MMGLNLRKLAAVVSAAAMLAVAGPVAVSTANAADAPAAVQTAAQHVTVQFNYGKGRIVPVTLDKGTAFSQFAAKVETPAAPEGNVFGYWADASKLDDKPVADATPVNDTDFEVYPVFVKAATVTFNGLDAAAGYVKQVTLKSGSKFSQFVDELKKTTSLPTPPEGFELVFKKVVDGVKTDLKGDEPVTDGFEVSVEFAKKPVELVFVVFNMGADMGSPTQVQKGSTWAEVKGQAPSLKAPEGKAFAGWTVDGKEVLADSYVFDAPTTNLYPLYEDAKPAVEHVTVTFYEDESLSSVFKKVENVEKDKTTFAELAKKVGTPTREGKVFAGWKGVGTDVLDPNATFTFPRDTALIAVWKDAEPAPATVQVTFLKADGSYLTDVPVAKGTLFGVASQGIQAPTVPGKVFTGWAQQGGALTEEGFALETDLTVTATYRDVYQPQPQFPWWGNWWTAFQHWWGSWNHWFNGWWR